MKQQQSTKYFLKSCVKTHIHAQKQLFASLSFSIYAVHGAETPVEQRAHQNDLR